MHAPCLIGAHGGRIHPASYDALLASWSAQSIKPKMPLLQQYISIGEDAGSAKGNDGVMKLVMRP